jgi:hypothetical protein
MSYKTGRVYRIICLCDPEFQYVGSTMSQLRHRWQNHKGHYKQYLDGKRKKDLSTYDAYDKHGIENFKIILIKEYKVYDKNHLQAYEQLWINKIKCINKYMPFYIKYLSKKGYREKNKEKYKEYEKEYREKNKEKIAKKNKEYRKKNKEEIAEKDKEYYEKNKDKILERRKEKYTCACGTTLTKTNKSHHEKSKKHLNFISSINK